jgi:hypothetical protein
MNRDVVLVLSWRRANYLHQCLDALSKARGIENKTIWVFQNNRQDEGIDLTSVRKVLTDFKSLVMNINVRDGRLAQYAAWELAYLVNAPFAYFILDDVVVTPDFFEWHESVQADEDWFGSTAWRPDGGQTKPFDVESYYRLPFPNEISIGFCAKRESIKTLLQTPPDWYPLEQVKNWKIAVPFVQRAYHIGAYSSQLNSGGPNTGSAIDVLPNPIPDYGRQKAVLKP